MKKYVAFILLCAISFQTYAQGKKVVADKIIATIGDKIILKSTVDNELFDHKRNGEVLPPNANCMLLENLLGIKALVLQAERDSLYPSDEQLEGNLDNKIRAYISRFGSKEVLEQVAGKTVFQLKEDMRPNERDMLMAQNERNKIIADIRITPDEVTAYYNQIPKDSLKFYESEMTIGQIVLYPKPSRDVETYVIDQLKEYKKEVEEGKKTFESLARLYSDDPGTKNNGGLFELNRNDKNVDPTFLAKAFGLKDGQVSTVFKSQFGYHIIQMVSRRGDDATVRHILKIPQLSSIEINESIEKLDSIRTLLVDGKIGFGAAVDKFSEDKGSKFTGGLIANQEGSTNVTIDQLDKDLVFMLKDLKVGTYSKPVEFADYTGKRGVRLIYLISKTEPHRENLRDDYDKVSQRALEEKQNDAINDWFVQHLPSFYINIDPEYASCPEMTKWANAAAATVAR